MRVGRVLLCVTFFMFINHMDISLVFSSAADMQSAVKPGAGDVALLKAGETIEARVAQILAKGQVLLDLGSEKILVKTQIPLKPGQQLSLQVEQGKGEVRLVIQNNTKANLAVKPDQAKASQAAKSEVQMLRSDAGRQTQKAPAMGSATKGEMQTQTRDAAMQPRVAPQNSRPQPSGSQLSGAPLSGQQPSGRQPSGQQPSGPQLSGSQPSGQLPSGPPLSGQQSSSQPQGIESVRVENLPRAAAPASAEAKQILPASRPAVPPNTPTLQDAVSKAVQNAITNQGSLSGLFAEARQMVQNAAKPLPDTVQNALRDLLGLRLSAGEKVSGVEIKQAFSRSGLFLENRLKPGSTQGQAIQSDIKSALFKLQGALQNWLGGKTRPFSPPETRFHPPFRQGLPQGQPPRPPVLEPGSPLQEAGRVLLGETRAALSRLTLLQVASMPTHGESAAQRAGPEWNFEIPFRLGAETAIAQFRIDSEEQGETGSGQRRWRVHVSVDTPETGPVHAALGLGGKSMRVSLWAVREETLAMFRSRRGELQKAFEENGLNAENISFRKGAPNARILKPGSMMDQVR